MANELNHTAVIADISDVERTMNYIQFQLSQADAELATFAGTDAKKICYVHLLAWKQELQTELHELRKALKRKA